MIPDRDDKITLDLLLSGNFRDSRWREAMRRLLLTCSPGPFEAPNLVPAAPLGPNDELSAAVTNRGRSMLADCGPLDDTTSRADAIAFAAAMNAIKKLLDEGIVN